MHYRAVHYLNPIIDEQSRYCGPLDPYTNPAPMTIQPLPTRPTKSPAKEILARLAELGVLSAASAETVTLNLSWDDLSGTVNTHLADEATDESREDTEDGEDGEDEVEDPESIEVDTTDVAAPSQW
jgi:hypothetical protein